MLTWLVAIPVFAHTWDVLNKSMDAYNRDGGLPTNEAWQVNQGGNAGGIATQEENYVNFTKTKAGGSGSGCWAWIRPADALPEPVAGTSYSIEVKARVHPVGVPDDGSYIEANQMALRVGSKNIAAPIYLKYGEIVVIFASRNKQAGCLLYFVCNNGTLMTQIGQIYADFCDADAIFILIQKRNLRSSV